ALLVDWRRLRERSAEILDGLGIGIDPRTRVARLSLAQRQMVEIARALSFDARVVLLDEPTSGLARAEGATLFRLMPTVAARGVAVVYVTHRLTELREIADAVTALRDGRVTETIAGREATPDRLVGMMFGAAPTAAPPRPSPQGALLRAGPQQIGDAAPTRV